MILSSFEKKHSPYVWLQYRRTPKEKKRYSRTQIRTDDPNKKRLLDLAMTEFRAHLLTTEEEGDADPGKAGPGWTWVPGYIRARWGGVEGTLRVYAAHWKAVSPFLQEYEILAPKELTRHHCQVAYVKWRTAQVKEKSRRNPGKNVSLDELKLLAIVMDEAMERGLVDHNPARRLGLKRDATRVKPEFTDDQAAKAYRALQTRPEWMYRSFHIAMQTGLRFAETPIDLAGVSWIDRTVHIGKPKGGITRAFTIALYPSIEKVLRDAEREGLKYAWELPPKERRMIGLVWTKFFREIGLPNHSFHSTRVTFITRGMRAGIPESAMMKLVNHASKEVHRIYQRHHDSDGLSYQARMNLPQPESAAGAKRQNPRHRVSRQPKGAPLS